MYKLSARRLDKTVISQRTLERPPTNADVEGLLREIDEDCFIDICRDVPDFVDIVFFDQELEFDLVAVDTQLEMYDE